MSNNELDKFLKLKRKRSNSKESPSLGDNSSNENNTVKKLKSPVIVGEGPLEKMRHGAAMERPCKKIILVKLSYDSRPRKGL